jgi:hypothetical protein
MYNRESSELRVLSSELPEKQQLQSLRFTFCVLCNDRNNILTLKPH